MSISENESTTATTDDPRPLIPVDTIAELRAELDAAGQHPHPEMRDGLSYAALFPYIGPLLDTAEQAHRLRAENERLRRFVLGKGCEGE